MHVVQLVPRLGTGGAESSALEIDAALQAAGHRSTVISAGGKRAAEIRGEHIELQIAAKNPRTLFAVRPLRALLTELNPDLVHARSRLPAWLGLLALRKTSIPWITTLHGLHSVSPYSEVMLRSDAQIAVSESARQYWCRHYQRARPEAIRVIHRGVDPQRFSRAFEPAPTWKEEFLRNLPAARELPRLLLPGRISPIKNQASFVRMISALHARGQPCVGLIAGGGNERRIRRLKAQIEDERLGNHVMLLGNRTDMRELMSISDLIFSLTTKPESFGRTTVEALALGRPVIGFDHGGVGEILSICFPEGRVRPNQFEPLVDRTADFLRNPPENISDVPFTLERMQRQTVDFYRELIA